MSRRIALTMGDQNGIGPEVILKALARIDRPDRHRLVLVGAAEVFAFYARSFGLDDVFGSVDIIDVPTNSEVLPGSVSSGSGESSMRAVSIALEMCLRSEAHAMVTAPISKEAIALAGYDTPGHTEFIARRCNTDAAMVMVAPGLRIALLTVHVPLKEVAVLVTRGRIVAKARVFNRSLSTDFGIASPRIAVLGLNPHAGDGGVIGTEESDVIAPAIDELSEAGVRVEGPFPADGFFGQRRFLDFDGVLAMYHDQGLVAFKALSFGKGVNFTAGLPVVRTSPDHGTAFGIAGKGTASAGSFLAAIEVAGVVAAARERSFQA